MVPVTLALAGDTNGDGTSESFLQLLHAGEDELVEQRFIIDPLTVRALHRGNDLFALSGTLANKGDDMAFVKNRGQGDYLVTALDGRTAARLWSRLISVPRTFWMALRPQAAGGTKSSRHLLVTFHDRHSARVVLMDGRTGRFLWSRSLNRS